MIVTAAHLEAYRLPLPRAAPEAAPRRGLWLTLADELGHVALGEAAPLPGFSVETLAETRAALDAFVRGPLPTVDDTPAAVAALLDDLRALAWPAAALHALDQALLTLLSERLGRPLHALLGAAPDPGPLVTHRLVRDAADARRAAIDGVRAVKLKLGADPTDALSRLAAARALLGPAVALRLDANGALTEAAARALLRAASVHPGAPGLDLVEEPLAGADLAAMARLRAAAPGVRIAADESCRGPADLEAIAAAGAADAVVLKPMLLGGPTRAAAMARRAAALGLAVSVTTSFDSPRALPAARAVALACPAHARLSAGLDPTHACCPLPPRGPALPNPVAAAARARPDHLALRLADAAPAALTWGALADRVARTAGALAALGVVPGDVVALDTGRAVDLDLIAAIWGVAWLGAAALPLGHRATDRERAAVLAAACPDHRVAPAALALAARGAAAAPERDWPLDEVRLVLPTGGTGGAPRPVALATGQLAFNAFGSALRVGHDPDDRWLLALPLDHVGGLALLWRAAWGAATTVVHRRFDAAAVARALDAGEVSHASLVPEMLARVLDARPDAPLPPTVRALLIGGAPCPPGLLARARRLDLPLALTWGMTESASQVATAHVGRWDAPDAVGPPLAVARVHADPAGRLHLTGPLAGPAGHLATADRGAVAPDGRVRVVGRVDDVFVSGGENVDPSEVEAALCAHPSVAEALAVGVADPRWGCRPVAALVGAPGSPRPTDDALRDHLGPRLSRFKHPARLLWLDALPRTPLGKPSRAALRALIEEHSP